MELAQLDDHAVWGADWHRRHALSSSRFHIVQVELAQLAQQDSSTLGERGTPEPGSLSRGVQRQLSVGGAYSMRRTSLSVRPHAPASPRNRAADGDDAGDAAAMPNDRIPLGTVSQPLCNRDVFWCNSPCMRTADGSDAGDVTAAVHACKSWDRGFAAVHFVPAAAAPALQLVLVVS